jgi:hypothetical protein
MADSEEKTGPAGGAIGVVLATGGLVTGVKAVRQAGFRRTILSGVSAMKGEAGRGSVSDAWQLPRRLRRRGAEFPPYRRG